MATDLDGTSGFATAGEAVRLWSTSGADAGSPGMTLEGPPLLVARTDSLAATWEGAASVQALGALGVDVLAAGGLVAGLGTWSERFTWTLSDAWLLVDEDAGVVALPAEPGAFLPGALDGDTDEDALVLHAGAASLVRGLDGEVVTVTLGFEPGAAALLDDDGDACLDLWVVDGERLEIYRVADCAGHLDQDGDGWTPDGGDCDDADPDIHPAALETCDGRDEDCDGAVDELMVAVTPVVVDTGGDPRADSDGDTADRAPEGEGFAIEVGVQGCFADGEATLSWDEEGPVSCVLDGEWRLRCRLLDQGHSALTVRAVEVATGAVLASAHLAFAAHNVAPTLGGVWRLSGCGHGVYGRLDTGLVTVWAGNDLGGHLAIREPGDDVVRVDATSDNPHLHVGDDGHFSFLTEPDDIGLWPIDLVLTDEDGGVSAATLYVKVLDPAMSGGCGNDDGGGGSPWGCGVADGTPWSDDDGGITPGDLLRGCLEASVNPCGCNAGGPGFTLLGVGWFLLRRRRSRAPPT
ncbi:MAG: MopE-related protein [Pseudomonadota bacterium]